MSAASPDPFALGGCASPSVEGFPPIQPAGFMDLWNEHRQLDNWRTGLLRGWPDAYLPRPEGFSEACARWEDRMLAIEDELASRIGNCKTDLVAQLRLLIWRNQDYEWSEWDTDLVRKVIVGITTLGVTSMTPDEIAALIAPAGVTK